jgi:hypothetical protein
LDTPSYARKSASSYLNKIKWCVKFIDLILTTPKQKLRMMVIICIIFPTFLPCMFIFSLYGKLFQVVMKVTVLKLKD